jgi:hypothetical protein
MGLLLEDTSVQQLCSAEIPAVTVIAVYPNPFMEHLKDITVN